MSGITTQRLEELIRVFGEQHLEWSTREGATDQCEAASHKFAKFLGENGLGSKVVEINPGCFPHIYPPEAEMERGANVHEVVKVGDDLVDWTIRQYIPDARYPTAFPDWIEQPAKRRLSVKGGCGTYC